VSTRHTLALTNTGGASADDVLELARAIRDRVERAFGITLQPEPRLVNCAL
jgi:UDP-N-acetylmuramate dehydrogenase